ncbi:MAG: TonB-dependent receptor [Candidatus Kapabacteria bacterium]|nr:TonB-dependent receptor [Candidatus Kapabacteria bacterium]
MKLRLITLSIILLCFTVIKTYSANSGIIAGNVIDSETGEPLRRATVKVVGTTSGGYTDVKGEFKIKNVPVGKHIVKISYVGYSEREKVDVEVKADEIVNIGKTVLGTITKAVEEIFVDARRINDNEAAILALRKNAAQVSDGISRQEMSRLPDSDAGQSLKRVSGITLVDNKFVYVRGVSERYSNTTLNGASLSSTEPDKKAFAFDMFPSEFLQNVNIAKSFTPDLPGNFAGGLVQLNTVDFPESKALKVSYSNSINTNTSMRGEKFLQSQSGSTDWLGFDDGTRRLPVGVPSTRREFDALRVDANNSVPGAKEKYESMMQSFNSKNWKQNRYTVGPASNSGLGINYSNVSELFENQFGFLGSVNWGQSYNIDDIERNGLLANGSKLFSSNGIKSVYNSSLGGLVNMAYKIGNSSSISLRNVYNRSADDISINLDGLDYPQQLQYKNYSSQFVEKEIYSVQLGGDNSINLNNMFIQWNLGYSYSNRYEPDYRKVRYDRSVSDAEYNPGTPYRIQLTATEQGDGARVGRFYSDMNDNSYSGKIDITLPLIDNIKLKFGTLAELKDRDFSARSITIITPPTDVAISPDIEDLMTDYENPQLLFASENFRVDDGLRISEETKLSDSYKANEDLFAGYLMLDIPFATNLPVLGNQNFRFIGGFRFEDSKQVMNSYTINDESLDITKSNQDFLPSLNLMWKLNDISNIRISASQTLTRPSLREFAPFSFYDFENSILVYGNPNLERAIIQNYDFRYEFFPNPGEVISAGFFYKKFENAIEETIQPLQSELGKSFANSDGDAINYGIEIEFRKSMGFITESLRNLALNINFAYINSEITVFQGNAVDKRSMWGQSPYSLNIGLFYMHPEMRTSVNLAYNTFGRRIIQVAAVGQYDFKDPHIYELPRDVIDLSISQPVFNDKLELSLNIRDLLNQNIIWQQGGETYSSSYRGTTIGISFGYKLY